MRIRGGAALAPAWTTLTESFFPRPPLFPNPGFSPLTFRTRNNRCPSALTSAGTRSCWQWSEESLHGVADARNDENDDDRGRYASCDRRVCAERRCRRRG